MYPAVPAKMTENTGEREEKREIRRMERKMNAVLLSVMDFLPNLMTVSKIKTHTQTRMPAKAWMINGFAAKLERNMAIAVIISMEGVLPDVPFFQNDAGEVISIPIFGDVKLAITSLIEVVMILLAAFLSFKTTNPEIRKKKRRVCQDL